VDDREERPAAGRRAARGEPVPAEDRFFLYVESPAAPQHVGGVALVDVRGLPEGRPARQDMVALAEQMVRDLPPLRRRLSAERRWRRPRWLEQAPDLDWHVVELSLPAAGGLAGLWTLVGDVASTRLPRDRPLWRLWLVHVEPGLDAVLIVLHHSIADGIGGIATAARLFRPDPRLGTSRPAAGPGRLQRAAGIVLGLARLATDGRATGRMLGGPMTAGRRYTGTALLLAEVRAAAGRHGVRVSDVVLCSVAGGLSRVRAATGDRWPATIRVAVTQTVRDPGEVGAGANVTAATMIDLPIAAMPEPDRLRLVAARTAALRGGSRALASRFVMHTIAGLMPPAVHRWFARAVYGGRFFHAIVSNLPGPRVALTMAGGPSPQAYPVLPLAPDAPLAIGALGWHEQLCVGIAAAASLLDDPDDLADAIRVAFDQLRRAGPAADGRPA
jgi:diacylglycerol O-acyltransferase